MVEREAAPAILAVARPSGGHFRSRHHLAHAAEPVEKCRHIVAQVDEQFVRAGRRFLVADADQSLQPGSARGQPLARKSSARGQPLARKSSARGQPSQERAARGEPLASRASRLRLLRYAAGSGLRDSSTSRRRGWRSPRPMRFAHAPVRRRRSPGARDDRRTGTSHRYPRRAGYRSRCGSRRGLVQ